MLKKIYNVLADIQTKRAAYWQLRCLSDKQLKDIGLYRGDIYDIVYGQDQRIENG